ncbi:MAG: hypothetical protein IJ458_03545 [Clostridia bacterium]|nr:hypothetical protein [Clostridia bacterium]
MKKILTVVAIFMTMLCGSVFLVSCSKDYSKMYLEVEYCVSEKNADGEWEIGDWVTVSSGGQFDHFMSDSNSKRLHLRVNVKGTSKKVDSLYISQSVSTSIMPESRIVKPNEAFEMIVNTIGSVRFTITPSQGGEDKAVSFGVNVYKELTGISQNENCVPGVVVNGYVKLDSLPNLIEYAPIGETNQTGVNFSFESVESCIGSLEYDNSISLINRNFIPNTNYELDPNSNGTKIVNKNNANEYVELDTSTGQLMLNVSTIYDLTTSNNVIKLKATSKYYEEITTNIYVYIVDNFTTNSLSVSYDKDNQQIINSNDNINLYNASVDVLSGKIAYNNIQVYTSLNSIYSYQSSPSVKLKVYINGAEYDYNSAVSNNLGIQVTPVTEESNGVDKLTGLKFAVNPNANTDINLYNVRLELDFDVLNFSASDEDPKTVLYKEFTISVKDLASGFYINGKAYGNNLDNFEGSTITGYESTQPAQLYTTYSTDAIGMPLNIQATPTSAINSQVYVGFYGGYEGGEFKNNLLKSSNQDQIAPLQLMKTISSSFTPNNSGEVEIDFSNKNRIVYLKFNELALIPSNLEKIYMVCSVLSTPETWLGATVTSEYVTFVATIDVVGAVDGISVYKDSDAKQLFDDEYVSNAKTNQAYIDFRGSNFKTIDFSKIEITSSRGYIKYSSNGETDWDSKITADMLSPKDSTRKIIYFRTEQPCEDSLIISSPNGINCKYNYKFVNTSSAEGVKIEFDETYIWKSKIQDNVDLEGVTSDGAITLKYLALQSGRSAQFTASGDGKNSTIKSVQAKSLLVNSDEYGKIINANGESKYNKVFSSFSSSAIKVSNSGGYLFDISANSNEFTSILFVKVEFYTTDNNVVVLSNKYFIYEVAVYVPARDLRVNTVDDKNSIIYINQHYPDVAKVTFNIGLNSATTSLTFSSSAVNDEINKEYSVKGIKSIYGIAVKPSESAGKFDESAKNEHFKLNNLYKNNFIKDDWYFINNDNKTFSVQALQSLNNLGYNSISFDIVIYQFGEEKETTKITKVISFGVSNPSEKIIITSGVETYNNVYLSLMKGATSHKITADVISSSGEVTYKDLGCKLYLYDETTKVRHEYSDENLQVSVEDNTFTITAKNAGGVYVLVLYAKDSYNASEQKYDTVHEIKITVSDGASAETAYLIQDLDDFVALANTEENVYYRLWKDIDISALSDSKTDYYEWWSTARTFNGVLDGSMSIEDFNTGKKIYQKYSLIGLKVSNYNLFNEANCFGLFNSVGATGIIHDVVFDEVEIDISLTSANTANSSSINIGAITAINYGQIVNCNVNIVKSKITFNTDANSAEYNIGLIAGLNSTIKINETTYNGTISYSNENIGSIYSHIVDVDSNGAQTGILSVEILNDNTNNLNEATINIGGVVGNNNSLINADYVDGNSKSVGELINAVVHIELKFNYDASNAPMTINDINIGGIGGLNSGIIKNISVSGSIIANDKVNIGGIVGQNIGTVKEVANYGAHIEGYSLNNTLNNESKYNGTFIYHGSNATQEQNIGGIIGYNNAGTVDNVRVMFITFAKGEVSIASSSALVKGVGNVAGVVAKATNTQLTRAYVENFIIDESVLTYNIVGDNANVAGLIACIKDETGDGKTATNAMLSFVQADFDVRDCVFYEFGKDLTSYKYVYFIGDVLSNNITDNKLNSHQNLGDDITNEKTTSGTSYIINNVVYGAGLKNVVKYGLDNGDITIGATDPNVTIDIDGKTYVIQWRQSDEKDDENVNGNYPYLIYIHDTNVYYTLTVKPTEIIVNVDENYFDKDVVSSSGNKFKKYDNGLYLQYVDNNNTPENTKDDDVVSTAIVYYVDGDENSYKLVSDGKGKGLIEKTILPNLEAVNGSYSVSIVSGSNIATLTDGGIKFSGVGKVELKFVSLFDRTKTDNVTIFVEKPLHAEVFDVTASSGLEDRNQQGQRFTTMAEVHSLLSLNIKDVDGQAFDSAKTYMMAEYGSGVAKINDVETDVADVKPYFDLKAITEQIGGNSNKYVLGQFNVQTSTLNPTYSYLEIPIKLKVYLNLDNYYIGQTSLSTFMGNTSTLLQEKDITIVIYNKATDLKVSSDVKAESGKDVDITAQLTTGYVDTQTDTRPAVGTTVGLGGEKLILNEISGYDKIEAVLTTSNANAEDLLTLAKQTSNNAEFGIWDLFERVITYRLTAKGYNYSINIRLKEDYRNLDLTGYTEREWKFNLNIKASSNTSLSKDVEISFVPQQLLGLRVENYSNLVAKTGSNNATTQLTEYQSSQTESSLVIPGESGLIKIFADYSYSYFDNITISSSRETINGKEYFIRYQQMVYDKTNEVYKSYAGITAEGESLTLKRVSYIENGEYKYDGVLFIRTILDEIVGVRQTFTITVNANTYDLNGDIMQISRTKTVISQYRPGVYINVEDTLSTTDKDGNIIYLVEQNSNVSTIVAQVYGYEFDIQPVININAINANDTISDKEVAIVQQGDVELSNTGAYIIKYRLVVSTLKPFKVTMQMSLIDNGNTLTNKTNELLFYPVPYIINNVHVKGEANGGLTIPVNTSKNLELVWTTKSTTNAKISAINAKINELNYLDLFYVEYINSNGQDDKKLFSEYLDATNTSFKIVKNADNTYRIESLIKVDPIVVNFNLWYGYVINDDGSVNVEFRTKSNSVCKYLKAYQFRLILTMETTEDAPTPINNADDLLTMSEGQNYILMEDITVENWTPLNTAIASLDGNGKVINIVSFNMPITATMNVGLFGTLSENTILKNVVVNVSPISSTIYIKDDNVVNSTINFGFLAGINKGLIYNCEVIALSGSTSFKNLEIAIGDTYNLTFGSLVGINQGNITNSRVGTEYFQRLTYADGVVLTAKIQCSPLYITSKGIMAGFVGQNDNKSIISSSFVANVSIENTSNVGNSELNRTAGFVATNNGTISYSYVKGLERNILTTKSTTSASSGKMECVIYASGAGSVAGFVYLNGGDINDCYTNTVCKSNSAGVAGFVYNTVKGSVNQCYSATRVESGNTNTALATELPFVGVGIDKKEAQQLLSSDKVLNCYYLDDGTEYDTHYIVLEGVVEPKGLSLENFANFNNLNNFSFISDSTSEQQLNGVWTYSTAIDRNRSTYSLSVTSLPELTSANTIARSLRIYANAEGSADNDYKYPTGYEMGSKNNPHIIRSEAEYQSVFVDSAPTTNKGISYKVGYVRFIDDISFNVNDEFIDIDTRSNYILGDENTTNKSTPEFTVIDGNGMTISDVVINHTEDETEKGTLGLFSKVYNAVIKGLNIGYATQTNVGEVGSSTASYVGGVAGIAHNTYFIDLNLTGKVTLRAHNVIGGVVGRLTGENSGLYNITSNLNVQAGNYSNSVMYDGKNTEDSYLSYAGGIAGIIDIGSNNNSEDNINVNKLTVDSSNVRANRAGGIAGYMGKNINAKRLTYTISNTSQIFGREVAGGMVADNHADIQLSQVNGNVETQYDYDSEFARYINNQSNIAINNLNKTYGNLSAITGDKIAGGFVGVNYDGDITNSLTKANIGHNDDYGMADIVGGFIGRTYGGNLTYVYAQNYIDLVYETIDLDEVKHTYYAETVGGLIGHIAYSRSYTTADNPDLKVGFDNVVVANWFDEIQVDQFNQLKVGGKDINIDYVVGKVDDEVNNEDGVNRKKNESNSPIVSYGVFNADIEDESQYRDGKIVNQNVASASDYDMEALYYIGSTTDATGNSTQQEIFSTLFAVWPELYWHKEYTKFMPNLKNDDSVNYIIIDDEDDIKLMEQNPDGNFILVKDLPVTAKGNYVVNANFTGVLIGTQIDGRYTTFKVSIDASTKNDLGAGFFKQTTGARIANIGFEYTQFELGADNNSNEYKVVGGVSAKDTGSRFEQVDVSQTDNGSIKTIDNASVVSVGSIVGEGTRSNIISCSSTLKYNVSVREASNNTVGGNIGGLVGYLYGYNEDVDEQGNITIRYEGLITSSQYSGEIKVLAHERVSIGGIIAKALYTRISDSRIVKESNNVCVYIQGKDTNYIGGIVGDYDMCSISYCYSHIDILDRPDTQTALSTDFDTTYYVGGIVGKIGNQNTIDKDIEDSYTRLTFGITKANNAYVGGIAGLQASNNSQGVHLNRLVSDITINAIEKTENSTIDTIDNMVVGGIVALAQGKPENISSYGTVINSCMAIMDCNIDYNNTLFGGGLIGEANGSYMISSSTAMGKLFANNKNNVHMSANSTSTLTVLGGLVGLAGENRSAILQSYILNQEINNSYSALTLSTAGVYEGDVTVDEHTTQTHQVYANAVVGYTDTTNIIKGSGLLYSSDYTLTVESDNVFVNTPINVTAGFLINNEESLQSNQDVTNTYAINGYMGDAWLWKQYHLPLPLALQDLLVKMDILQYNNATTWSYNANNIGKPYYPILVQTSDTNSDSNDNIVDFANINFNNDYRYYILIDEVEVNGAKGNLNGLLMGNGKVITSTTNLFDTINKHSAISNLTFILTDDFAETSAVARTNNGTIFMIGVQYENIEVVDQFGALASHNYGVVSNCYNIGHAMANGDVGGLVYVNEPNASIKYSYFTGSFSGGSFGSALVNSNDGNVSNCYSAGMASTVIGNLNDSLENARYKNIYYDYYANYTKIEDYNNWATCSILGLSTKELQEVEGIANSKLFKGWKVYSMHNLDKVSGNSNESVNCTYNYGYPIHNLPQLTYSAGKVQQLPIRVKSTGDGTFDKIVDENGMAITQISKTLVQGKLVRDEQSTPYEYYDNFAFLINNLGVLDLINTIENTTSKYFELEVDMVLLTNPNGMKEGEEKLLTNWRGIGSVTPFSGVFTTTSNDFVESDNNDIGVDLYKLNRTLLDESLKGNVSFYNDSNIVENNSSKSISNLTGGALFACINKGALIANIDLKDSKVNSAPLVGNVGVIDDSADIVGIYDPTIYNVNISGSVTANSNSSIAGLVDTVREDTTLNIYGVANSKEIKLVANNSSINVAGAININQGTINLKHSFNGVTVKVEQATNANIAGFINKNDANSKINIVDKVEIKLNSPSLKQASISGFVYENAGSILTKSDENSIVNLTVVGITTNFLAGFVGNMQGGVIAGFNIIFPSDQSDAYETNILGGVVASFKSGQLGMRKDGDDDEDKLIVVDITSVAGATANIFGGIVAIVDNRENPDMEAGKITNISLEIGEALAIKGFNGDGNAYGLIIGQYITKLQEINYTLEDKVTFKVHNGMNVGAIVGYAESATFNFTNEQPEGLITVYGLKNVGGLIGQYAGDDESITMEGNTWAVGSGDAYATVEFAYPPLSSQSQTQTLVAAKSENFGGLVGYWNSAITLQCSGNSSILINKNLVLSIQDWKGEAEFNYFTNTEKTSGYDYVLSNIGGIVGKCNANINNAQNDAVVGMEMDTDSNPHKGLNPIYSTGLSSDALDGNITQMLQFTYIGGIAGLISSSEDNSNITISNCANNASVYGMYAVGGLVGGTKGILGVINDNASAVECSESINVIGLADVGGIIGKAKDFAYTPKQNIQKFATIAGVTNVGGVVGNATNVTIENCSISNDETLIVGNINVGGLIGYSTTANIKTSMVADIKVTGSVFDYSYEVSNADTGKKEDVPFYYLPTNIGGVVGYVTGKSSFEDTTTNALVTTDEAFLLDNEDSECTVNMTSNYIGSVSISDEYYIANDSLSAYLEKSYTTVLTRYNAVDGGIGGFAGKLNASDHDSLKFVNSTINGDVYASYGINVGGTIGYLNADPQQVQLPTISSAGINVAGKIFVGGYIGKSRGFGSDVGTEFFDLNEGVAKINVQKYLDANGTEQILSGAYCVGGVVGYVVGNVYAINLRSDMELNIRVYNTDGIKSSMYVGTLVGGMSGNTLKNCSIAPEFCDAEDNDNDDIYESYYPFNTDEYYESKGIIYRPNVYNYGGLVGLVEPNSGNIEIIGEHYYPFTVDIIQTKSFTNGDSHYGYADNGVFTANAHYIHTGNIQVSATKLSELYDEDNTGTSSNKNPTNVSAKGWAKEYTMFRCLARVIDQGSTMEPSIQVVYSADYITGVYTTFDEQGLSDTIMYTIYQPIGQKANLYYKFGIAEQMDGFDDNYLKEEDNRGVKKYMDLADGANYPYENNEYVDVTNSSTSRDQFWIHMDNVRQLGLNPNDSEQIEWNDDGTFDITEKYDNIVQPTAQRYQLTFGYTYCEVANYLGRENVTYFVFTTVFGPYDEDKNELGVDPTCYSKSGSIFEVTGTAVAPEVEGAVPNGNGWIGWVVGAIALTGIAVALLVPGVREFLLLYGGATGAVGWWSALLLKAGSGILISIAVSSGLGAGKMVYEAVQYGKYFAQDSYNSIDGTSMGYLSASYGREISWQYGELDGYYDSLLIIEVPIETEVKEPYNEDGATLAEKYDIVSYKALLLKELDASVNESTLTLTCKVPLTYFNCTTSRNVPRDADKKITLSINDLGEDLKGVFELLGVSEIEVPKYYSVDNELYCYGGQMESEKILYPNYSDSFVQSAYNSSEYPILKGTIINSNGYAYILNVDNQAYRYYMVSDSGEIESHLKDEYRISRVINYTSSNLTFNLSNANRGAAIKLTDSHKNSLRWSISSSSENTSSFKIKTKLNASLVKPNGNYISYSINKVEDLGYGKYRYYFNNNQQYVDLSGEGSEDQIFFTINNSGNCEFVLVPYMGGSGFTINQMTNIDDKESMYYVVTNNGEFKNISCEYVLCSTETITNLEFFGNQAYTLTPVPDPSKKITIYKLKDNVAVDENTSFKDFVDKEITISVGDLNATYYRYSLSAEYQDLVGDHYYVQGDTVYIKTVQGYMKEKIGEEIFCYRSIYEMAESNYTFSNRYAYTAKSGDDESVTFYTRFYYGNNFFGTSVNYGLDEKDDVKSMAISELLLPTTTQSIEQKSNIFAESARVTLSPGGSTLWSNYNDKTKWGSGGVIKCIAAELAKD